MFLSGFIPAFLRLMRTHGVLGEIEVVQLWLPPESWRPPAYGTAEHTFRIRPTGQALGLPRVCDRM